MGLSLRDHDPPLRAPFVARSRVPPHGRCHGQPVSPPGAPEVESSPRMVAPARVASARTSQVVETHLAQGPLRNTCSQSASERSSVSHSAVGLAHAASPGVALGRSGGPDRGDRVALDGALVSRRAHRRGDTCGYDASAAPAGSRPILQDGLPLVAGAVHSARAHSSFPSGARVGPRRRRRRHPPARCATDGMAGVLPLASTLLVEQRAVITVCHVTGGARSPGRQA